MPSSVNLKTRHNPQVPCLSWGYLVHAYKQSDFHHPLKLFRYTKLREGKRDERCLHLLLFLYTNGHLWAEAGWPSPWLGASPEPGLYPNTAKALCCVEKSAAGSNPRGSPVAKSFSKYRSNSFYERVKEMCLGGKVFWLVLYRAH